MSFRVRLQQRDLPNGRVSIVAAHAVINALRIALRAESSALSARIPKRGQLPKLVRESIGMSLSAVESGSGTLVLESETASLVDIPSQVFDDFIAEAHRHTEDASKANIGIQKALLSLESLFRLSSPVEWIEFTEPSGKSARVTAATIERIKHTIGEQGTDSTPEPVCDIVGKLLELDLASHSLRIHDVQGEKITIHYDDILEPIVIESLNNFVTATTRKNAASEQELISLEVFADAPESQFQEIRSITQLISQQGLRPLSDFSELALSEPDAVSPEEFREFLRATRSGK